VIDLEESRYDRQERIYWWDQTRLGAAHVLVVGAGALGNEIVKNLALVGVGSIDIVDMDAIEKSNLARCALFRDADEGRFKAEALATAALGVNPTIRSRAFVCSVQELGTAWIGQYDVILAGLDSREARLWVNLACRRMGKSWIDGAIEGLQGLVRMFDVEGPCYDCTLGEADRLSISHRRSCALLSPEQIISGKTPTNATTASVVAAFEVQEAIKLIVGREDLLSLRGKVWRIEGETMTSYVMSYVEDENCMSHERFDTWIEPVSGAESLASVIASVEESTDRKADAVFFSDDILVIEPCSSCGSGARIIGMRPLVRTGEGRCADCGQDRPLDAFTSCNVGNPLLETAWETWAWPRQEPITLRLDGEYVHLTLVSHDMEG